MRVISVVILAGVVALACAQTTYFKDKGVKADKDKLHKQKVLLELLRHIYQKDLYPEYLELAKSFDIEDYYDHYYDVDAVKHFVKLYHVGFLDFDEVFSIFKEDHLEQVMALFDVFYYAKDWDTFYKSMVWARYNVHHGIFVHALSVAMVHRKDMEGLEMPAIYEIFPNYFFNAETIQYAQYYKQIGYRGWKKVNDVYEVYIRSNYTKYDLFANKENRMSYFTEDIGLNSFYYYFYVDYPFWFGGHKTGLYKDRRGEYFLYTHQQLLARYYMERLSNGLGEILDISLKRPIRYGYYPNLRYFNGYPFTPRPNYYTTYHEYNYNDVDRLAYLEARYYDAIDNGYFYLPDGSYMNITTHKGADYLGNLMQGNPDSMNRYYYKYWYEYFDVLTDSFYKDNYGAPTVLEHYETMLRDPLFWQYYKRMINMYWVYKERLPNYEMKDIDFDGVKIESVDVDKIFTYFDYFYSDITNAVFTDDTDKNFVIKAKQRRLTHMPFKMNLRVTSDKAQKSVVRIYLGPKYDVDGHLLDDLNENRKNYYLLHQFKFDLVAGKNVITADSFDFSGTVRDRTTSYEIYQTVMGAIKDQNEFYMSNLEAHSGFPMRMMIPKGKPGGQFYKLFFHISPYVAPESEQFSNYNYLISTGIGSGSRFVDGLPFGYPLDREIDETVWYTDNMYYYDVPIYYKPEGFHDALHTE